MKKILSLLLVLSLSLGLLGNFALAEEKTYELALITDVGTIDDKSFNQGTWEGLEAYAKEHNITHKYYQPLDQTTELYVEMIDQAIANGAKVVVTPGFLFEQAIFISQNKHENVHFILVDGSPREEEGADAVINANAVGIVYAEEQSGYLAGYAAVKDGYKKLGFMGGIAVPAVIRFGHGFIQGADAAAKELGLTDVEMKYYYTGVFWETPEVQNRAASWFESGTEVIFSCAGGAGSSVMAAAAVNNGKVIGVDTDQSGESETVITSAVKGLAESVYQTLELYYANEFPGGTTKVFDASVKGVGLPMETSQFKTFSQEDYDAVYEKLVNGEIVVDNSIGATEEIKVEAIKVTEEK